MKKIAIIGHLDISGNNIIGAVVKTRNICNQLALKYGHDTVLKVDICNWKERKGKVAISILRAFIQCHTVILVISDISGKLMCNLKMLTKVFHNNVLYSVVGGDIGKKLLDNPSQCNNLQFIKMFFVETYLCKEDMEKAGLHNVCVMRNFKDLSIQQNANNPSCTQNYSFCTFSRVTEVKGITDAINAIDAINRKGELHCNLDIYGVIDSNYKEEFLELVKNSDNCTYKGVIKPEDSVKVLCNYYCLLFPTRFEGEGIPGTIIDALAAGIPIISSHWRYSDEMLSDKVNAIIYDFKDYEGLISAIEFAIENHTLMNKMGYNNLNKYKEFSPSAAMNVIERYIEF